MRPRRLQLDFLNHFVKFPLEFSLWHFAFFTHTQMDVESRIVKVQADVRLVDLPGELLLGG
jgi:hypothetical protein